MAQTVLIVDDDAIARQIAHTALKSRGLATVMASDAMAALALAQKHKPDLVLLDLGLPAGGGHLFLKRLKMFPALATIPVVVISGMARAEHEPKALEAGATAYLEKPVRPEELVQVVTGLLG